MKEQNSVIVLVSGAHCSGKKTVCAKIKENISLSDPHIQTFVVDLNKYKDGNGELCKRIEQTSLLRDIEAIQTGTQAPGAQPGPKLILVCGLYSLFDRELRNMSSMKIFVDSDSDTRLARWVTRDVINGEYKLEQVLNHYLNHARPEFNEFIFPTKEFADVILPSDRDETGISLICDGVLPLLQNSEHRVLKAKSLYPRYDSLEDTTSERFDGEKHRFYDVA